MFHRKDLDMEDDELFDFLEINEDTSVLDAGCGDGFYTKKFVKKSKNVTAIDLHTHFFEELNRLGVKTYNADICNFTQGSYDLIFFANVFHDLGCQDSIFENLGKICKKYIAVLDFKPDTLFGPPKSIRIEKERMIQIFESHGFKLEKEKDFKYHYFLIFRL